MDRVRGGEMDRGRGGEMDRESEGERERGGTEWCSESEVLAGHSTGCKALVGAHDLLTAAPCPYTCMRVMTTTSQHLSGLHLRGDNMHHHRWVSVSNFLDLYYFIKHIFHITFLSY